MKIKYNKDMEPRAIKLSEIENLPQALALIEELLKLIEQQEERLRAFEEDNKRLGDQLNLDSHNSSNPPSKDKERKTRATKSLRQKSGRKAGGQKGHKGSTLEMSESPDKSYKHPISNCSACGKDLSMVAVSAVEKRQVFDLPPMKLEVTEHQAEIKNCPGCAHLNRGEFPPEARHQVQYGPRVKGLIVYLNQEQLIPYERTTQLFFDLFGQSLSQGSVLNANQECYKKLAPTEALIIREILKSGVVRFDETGFYEKTKRNWLHVASTPRWTYYFPHRKRGKEAMEAAAILPKFEGVAMHDHLKAYLSFLNCAHAFCNVHHLRELTRAFEQDGALWAREMKTLLLRIKESVDKAKEMGKIALSRYQISPFKKKYRNIVDAALEPYLNQPPSNAPPKRGPKKQSKVKNLLDRLDKYQTETLRFMVDFRVPFDNNLAERDIRMTKVKQKISGTFRSEDGTKSFCRIRGFISTLKKQERNVLEELTLIFKLNPIHPV